MFKRVLMPFVHFFGLFLSFFSCVWMLRRLTEEEELVQVKLLLHFLLVQSHVAKTNSRPPLHSNGSGISLSAWNCKLCFPWDVFLTEPMSNHTFVLFPNISNFTALLWVICTASVTKWWQMRHKNTHPCTEIQTHNRNVLLLADTTHS